MTTLDETLAVLEKEDLLRYDHVIDGDFTRRTDCLVLVERWGVWTAFFTDERASVVESSTRTYPDLSDALVDFLRLMRLRADEDRAVMTTRPPRSSARTQEARVTSTTPPRPTSPVAPTAMPERVARAATPLARVAQPHRAQWIEAE